MKFEDAGAPASAALITLALAAYTALAWAAAPPSAIAGAVTLGAPTGATVPATAIGLNATVSDRHLQDAAVPRLVRETGASIIRYPGGSTSDDYLWRTNSITPHQRGRYADPANTFAAFMNRVVRPTHAQPLITVNYGSNRSGTGGGSASYAARWVRYANVSHHYDIRYWEIGNEVYGNRYYGGNWETDLHRDQSPVAYAANAVRFIRDMKRVDPKIEVGIVVIAPGTWPAYVGVWPPQKGRLDAWNPAVLSGACRSASFISFHWYPQKPGEETDQGLLAAPYRGTSSAVMSVTRMMATLRSQIKQYCPRGHHVKIMVTESNSVFFYPGKQTTSPINALFLVEDYLEWLRNGVSNVSWWVLHEAAFLGGNNKASLKGSYHFGDMGLLASSGRPEPPVDTPFPAFTGLQLLHEGLTPGATFLSTRSTVRAVHAYATRAGRSLSVYLVNSSAGHSYSITVRLENTRSLSEVVSRGFSLAQPKIHSVPVSARRTTLTVRLPPYSAALVTASYGRSEADS